jgi:YggT family protein
VSELLCAFITVFIVVLIVRAVLSWFPLEQGGFLAQVNRLVVDVTDWAVVPLRRVIPPVGMFDISFLVLVFGLFILRSAIC